MNDNSNSKPPANSNAPVPLFDPMEAAIQSLLASNPALTRAEIVDSMDFHGALDKRFYVPQ